MARKVGEHALKGDLFGCSVKEDTLFYAPLPDALNMGLQKRYAMDSLESGSLDLIFEMNGNRAPNNADSFIESVEVGYLVNSGNNFGEGTHTIFLAMDYELVEYKRDELNGLLYSKIRNMAIEKGELFEIILETSSRGVRDNVRGYSVKKKAR
jgi:hypothetical protein